jgi:DNA processing protein
MDRLRREGAAVVALLRAGRRPWQQYAGLLEEAGSAVALLDRELGPSERAPHQQSLFDAAAAADQNADLDAIAGEIAAWEAGGLQLVTILDDGYPENLRGVHDRPPLIFVAGRLHPGDARSAAVVGTRRPSPAGQDAARSIAEHLAAAGYTVVSGLAAGIDTAAHTATLASGGRTVAVIGTGLKRTYPAQNARLQRRIASEAAVVSQFWPDAPPSRRSFPMRNAVMSGLTLATIVVEAAHTSGSRMQARLALAQGRPVFLHELLRSQPWAVELAARPGVHVISAAAQITATIERLTCSGALTA